MRLAVWIFKFFASLRLALFLLAALAGVFAAGTFIESAHGAEAARLMVYRSPWMSLLLILLALNVLAAALDRLPWKRKHVGFVITHAGILLILAGSLVTRAYGVEGQMAVAEGETASRMVLNEARLQIFSPELGLLGSYAVPPHAFPWRGKEVLHLLEINRSPGLNPGDSVRLLRYLPKAKQEEKVEESSGGSPALEVALESSFMKVNHWLFLDDPKRNRILLGPAELRFTREPLVQKTEPEGEGLLEFQFEDLTVKVPLPQKLPAKIPLKGTPYRVTALRVLKDAVVDQGQLVNQSEAWTNPACELVLEGRSLKEKHTVFSKFPDFPTLHGMKPSQAGVRIYYRRPEEGTEGPKNELRFVFREGEPPLYQIRKGPGVSQGIVQAGQEQSTGWMDFKFRVEHYYPHARVSVLYLEAPAATPAEELLSAVEIELEAGGEKKSLWLGQGDQESVTLGGPTFQMIYGLRTLPLGFRIKLRDFRVENYPGTNQPASFESDVTLKDDSAGILRDLTIRMNQPLRHRGFKVYQSGYQKKEGVPEVSIFTVAKDPGVPVKYAGAVVLIGGILIMFYSRRFSNRPAQELKEAALVR